MIARGGIYGDLYGDGKEVNANHDEPGPCPQCGTEEFPSLNWRKGKPYSYCPICGYEEQSEIGD